MNQNVNSDRYFHPPSTGGFSRPLHTLFLGAERLSRQTAVLLYSWDDSWAEIFTWESQTSGGCSLNPVPNRPYLLGFLVFQLLGRFGQWATHAEEKAPDRALLLCSFPNRVGWHWPVPVDPAPLQQCGELVPVFKD